MVTFVSRKYRSLVSPSEYFFFFCNLICSQPNRIGGDMVIMLA